MKKPKYNGKRIAIKLTINIASFYAVTFCLDKGMDLYASGKIPGWVALPTLAIFGLTALFVNVGLWQNERLP